MNQLRMNILAFILLHGLCMACVQSEAVTDPVTQSPLPVGVAGKWLIGTFSLSSFWGDNGSVKPANEQAMAISLEPNGRYKLYVVNATTSYSCRTGSYTVWTGNVRFSETDRTMMLIPSQGTYRGEYSCSPNS